MDPVVLGVDVVSMDSPFSSLRINLLNHFLRLVCVLWQVIALADSHTSKIGKVVGQGLAEGCCLWPHCGKHCWQRVKKDMGILTLTSKTDASSLSH